MKKFIVPVDFSETSINAARYAAGLTNNASDTELILYNVFDSVEAGADGTPLERDDKGRKAVMELVLKSVENDISKFTDASIKIVAEEDDNFIKSLERYVRHNHIDLIIMGINGASNKLSQVMMGSNTLKVVRKNIAPVIIVPPDAGFESAKNIAFICDLKDITKSVPAEPVKKMLKVLGAKVHVVNINSDHYIEPTIEYKEEKNKLDAIIKDYDPEYSFMNMYNFVEAIDTFVKEKNIDLLLTIPKNDSFVSNLFKTTHTAKLAYHSHVPIVAIHA